MFNAALTFVSTYISGDSKLWRTPARAAKLMTASKGPSSDMRFPRFLESQMSISRKKKSGRPAIGSGATPLDVRHRRH